MKKREGQEKMLGEEGREKNSYKKFFASQLKFLTSCSDLQYSGS